MDPSVDKLCMEGDVLVLAGDILSFSKPAAIVPFLKDWKKPVLYVAGNHEYYNKNSIVFLLRSHFVERMRVRQANLTFLDNSATYIDGVRFFGGTMWTDFDDSNEVAMDHAQKSMNDFHCTNIDVCRLLTPQDTVSLHAKFKMRLTDWLHDLAVVGDPCAKVIITHHAPVVHYDTNYPDSPLEPAFVSKDMLQIIEDYEPELWIYGHTHQCDDQMVGKTRIISNQRGYSRHGEYECADFCPKGKPMILKPEGWSVFSGN